MSAERGVISYPIPLYQNLPIQPQFYKPSQFNIAAISLGFSTTITTSVNHNYVIGQEVRLIIPPSFGCRQLNQQTGIVISIPAPNQIIVSINSQFVDPFIAASSNIQVAQVVAIGDVNSGAINSYGIINQIINIPGSFINISPQ
jgi:hypothetical protein